MPDEFDPYQEWLGIEPHEHPVDHYRLLGIQQFETNPEVVHQAADERMTEIRLHQTGPRGRYTQQLLNEISAARVCLATAATRQAYDSQLVKLPEPPPVPPEPPPAPQVMPTKTPVPATAPTQVPEEEPEASPAGWSKILIAGAALLVVIAGIGWGVKSWMDGEPATKQATDRTEDSPSKTAGKRRLQQVVARQEGSGEIRLTPAIAKLHGKNLKLATRSGEDQIENWIESEDWVSWKFAVLRPGYFTVEVTYLAAEDADEGSCLLQVDQESALSLSIGSSAGQADRTGKKIVTVAKGGEHTLAVKVGEKPGKELLVLKSILLAPVKRE